VNLQARGYLAYTDEYDLFDCCAFFGTQGGMTVASRHLSGKDVKAYYGDTRKPDTIDVRSLAEEIERIVRSKIFNPVWKEGMLRHKYKGLGDISKKLGKVYGWSATTGEVPDWVMDRISDEYVFDEQMREEFRQNNPWALEEIMRRLLEAYERGLWDADEQRIEKLKQLYVEVEGWLE